MKVFLVLYLQLNHEIFFTRAADAISTKVFTCRGGRGDAAVCTTEAKTIEYQP
jgi:hypothetical protein